MKNLPMIFVVFLCLVACTQLNNTTGNSPKVEPVKNILFLIVDDLRPELKSFGANHVHSPNIDKLAKSSRVFLNQYVNAPSCGPSRYSMLVGRYGPPQNNALALRGNAILAGDKSVPVSMPQWFKQHGYTTVSVGKVSHHPGGLRGKNWNDLSKEEMPNSWTRYLMPVGDWHSPVGMMHGLAHGEVRKNPKDMDVFQAVNGNDNIYPDGLITDEAITQLNLLSQDKQTPFFLAVGIIKPHLPFGAPKRYLDLYDGVEFPENPYPNKPQGLSTWHKSDEFMKYNLWGKNPITDQHFADQIRRHYTASVSYADAQVGKILKQLKAVGADKNTIVVLWGDHGWNLGEHAIWGKHNLYEEGLRSPLLITYPGIPKQGQTTSAVVEATDIFPTLTALTSIIPPETLIGRSLVPQINNPNTLGHYAFSYQNNVNTLRMKNYRLTLFANQEIALYDHTSIEKETKNIADKHPEIVSAMLPILKNRMKTNDKY